MFHIGPDFLIFHSLVIHPLQFVRINFLLILSIVSMESIEVPLFWYYCSGSFKSTEVYYFSVIFL